MKAIGAQRQHRGLKRKFGVLWEWIHWIKPNGQVVILVAKV